MQRLAGDPAVSATALALPYPFVDGMAESWIGTHAPGFAAGTLAAFAVVSAEDEELCGAAGLMIEPEHLRAELGYWLGVEYWGNGYATEAAAAVIRCGFEQLGLRRIRANRRAAALTVMTLALTGIASQTAGRAGPPPGNDRLPGSTKGRSALERLGEM